MKDAPSDPHADLGVPTDATQPEIVRAFRRRLREHHPDTRPADGGPGTAAESDRELQRILAAYAALRDRQPDVLPDGLRTRLLPPVVELPTVASGGHRSGPALLATPVHWEPAGRPCPDPVAPPGSWTALPVPDLLLRWLLGGEDHS